MNRVFRYVLYLTLITLLASGCVHSDREDSEQVSGVSNRFTLGGAPVEVEVWLSSLEISLIDYLTVKVLIYSKEGVRLEPPYLSNKVFAPLALVEQPRERDFWDQEKERYISEWRYTFEPMNSGEFSLKPFSVFFRLNDEKPDQAEEWPVYQIKTEEIEYVVKSAKIDETGDIKDIKGLVFPDFNFIPLLITVGGLSVVLVVFVLIKTRIRSPSNDSAFKQVFIDYRAEALGRIAALEKKGFIEAGQANNHHTELSAILRDFIEKQFSLKAMEQTTEEFIAEIGELSIFSQAQKLSLNEFLRLSDLVKFASFTPVSEVSSKATSTAREFIETTGQNVDV